MSEIYLLDAIKAFCRNENPYFIFFTSPWWRDDYGEWRILFKEKWETQDYEWLNKMLIEGRISIYACARLRNGNRIRYQGKATGQVIDDKPIITDIKDVELQIQYLPPELE